MCMQTPRQRPPKLSRALLCALDVLFARSQFRILFSQDLLCCGYVASFSDKIRYVFLFTSQLHTSGHLVCRSPPSTSAGPRSDTRVFRPASQTVPLYLKRSDLCLLALLTLYCQAQPKPRLSWAEWLYFQLSQPPVKVYFPALAQLKSIVELSRQL